jgi:hypothetical protein
MLTNEALKTRARAIAESHFYSDDECEYPWEPFEEYDEEEIERQVTELAQIIFMALLWARNS